MKLLLWALLFHFGYIQAAEHCTCKSAPGLYCGHDHAHLSATCLNESIYACPTKNHAPTTRMDCKDDELCQVNDGVVACRKQEEHLASCRCKSKKGHYCGNQADYLAGECHHIGLYVCEKDVTKHSEVMENATFIEDCGGVGHCVTSEEPGFSYCQ